MITQVCRLRGHKNKVRIPSEPAVSFVQVCATFAVNHCIAHLLFERLAEDECAEEAMARL
jgi:hypothetical protein